jgi:hypothetical protein
MRMSNVIPFPIPDRYAEQKEETIDSILRAAVLASVYGDDMGMSDYDVDYLEHLAKKYCDKWKEK